MTESQLKLLPAFRELPVYDESDPRAAAVATARGSGYRSVRECYTVQEVEEGLSDPRLTPLGALRAGADGKQVVVVYFGESG